MAPPQPPQPMSDADDVLFLSPTSFSHPRADAPLPPVSVDVPRRPSDGSSTTAAPPPPAAAAAGWALPSGLEQQSAGGGSDEAWSFFFPPAAAAVPPPPPQQQQQQHWALSGGGPATAPPIFTGFGSQQASQQAPMGLIPISLLLPPAPASAPSDKPPPRKRNRAPAKKPAASQGADMTPRMDQDAGASPKQQRKRQKTAPAS
jgi:hypothetical protein